MLAQTIFYQLFQLNASEILALSWKNYCLTPVSPVMFTVYGGGKLIKCDSLTSNIELINPYPRD